MVSVSPRFPSTPNQVHFGPQPPQMDQPVPLQLMGDKNGMDRGPAWFFQQSYTKVVVVPGPFWEFDHGNTRRWFDLWRGRSSSRRLNPRGDGGIAPAAAKPWFCYWNNTILEGFIYVTQNSSGRVQPASTEYPWPSSPTGDYDPPAAAWSINSDQPPAMFTSFPPANPTMATGSMHKRQTPDPSELSAYTKVVKIEERRDPDVVLQPYCVHMQIMNDGTAQPLPEPSITLTATEPEDDESNYQPSRLRRRGPLFERDSSTSACECEWVSS
ncbi:MAG: hypothetical protein LQ338_005207 [Usnochroma carphineum]|nr:MAG: hypothetical protein LQ338_005207 [Usnochroma carphineum]